MRGFFAYSESLDRQVLRPLAHIRPNWDLYWDLETGTYREEEDSFANELNELIEELAVTEPPARYHDSEDRLAEYVKANLRWPISKVGNRWVGEDYDAILEQGGFRDVDQGDLVLAAAGRITAAIERGQLTYDDMEESHRRMLAAVLSVILYHRS